MADLTFQLEIEDKSSGLDAAADRLSKISGLLTKVDQDATKAGRSLSDMYRKVAGQERSQLDAIARERDAMIAQKLRPSTMKGSLAALFDASSKDVSGNRMTGLLAAARGEVDRLRPPLQKVVEEAAKVGAGFQGVGQTITDAKGKLHEFLSFTGALLAFEGIKMLAHGFEHVGEEILHAMIEQEAFKNALTFNVGIDGAQAFLGYQDQIVDHSLFLQQQTDKWGIELLRAGVPLKQIPLFLAAGEDVAAKSADRIGTMTGMMEAFVRAQRMGFIQGRQLESLGIGVEDLKKLPEFAGKTATEIRKKLTEGDFTAKQVLGIVAGMGPDSGKLGDLAETASNELGVKLMHLKERPELIFQNLIESPAFEKLKDGVDHLLDALDPRSPAGAQLFDSLEKALGIVGDLMSSINVDDLTLGLKAVLETVEDIAKAFGFVVAAANPQIALGLAMSDQGRAIADKAVFGDESGFGARFGHSMRALGSMLTFGLIDSPAVSDAPGALAVEGPKAADPTGGANVKVEIGSIHVGAGTGADPHAHAAAIASELKVQLRPAMLDVMEGMRSEQGN